MSQRLKKENDKKKINKNPKETCHEKSDYSDEDILLSESDDDSSDIFGIEIKPKEEVSNDFSIDTLLLERKKDSDMNKSNSKSEISEETEDEEPQFVLSLDDIDPIIPRDGSTFNFSQGNFPFRIFDLLDCPSIAQSHCIPRLKQWQLIALKHNTALCEPAVTTFFSIIQELITTESNKIGRMLLDYAKNFPDGSINFDVWFDFVREAMHYSIQSVCYLLSLGRIGLFKFENSKEKKKAMEKIMMVNISAMICPSISENPLYGEVLSTFRDFLKNSQFSSKQVNKFIKICYDLFFDVPSENISLIVSMFPIEGIGIQIIHKLAIKFGIFLLGCNNENHYEPTINDFAQALRSLKQLCHSEDHKDLNKASGILALSERAVLTGIKLKIVNKQLLDEIIQKLKFSIYCSEPGNLTNLKEQIHVTRSQLEAYIHALTLSQINFCDL